MSDARVLDALAEEMDVRLGVPTIEAARQELLAFTSVAVRPPAPTVSARTVVPAAIGEALLATWHELIDGGRMQDGDEHLAGTAKPVAARVSAATAAAIGVVAGGEIEIATATGALALPVVLDAMPAGVIWAPSNARGLPLRAILGAQHGSTVRIRKPV